MNGDEPLPPYTYVPGGPWPHPTGSAEGHSFGRDHRGVRAIVDDAWEQSAPYLRGVALFNAGYYWEAHEEWESLWHASGRRGPTADVLRALIKLAAAGVKVRERQTHGIATHARRASELFEAVSHDSSRLLGLDLLECAALARHVAETPPIDPEPPGARVSRVFPFRIEPGP